MSHTVQAIAKMIDHAVLHPLHTDADLRKHAVLAMTHDVASLCVKPYHTLLASTLLKESKVAVCTVIGFPHGNSTIHIKAAECANAIESGATEIDMVLNIGKVIQEDWEYVNMEIQEIQEMCRKQRVILKIIFETAYVTADAQKIRLCEICKHRNVAFVKTSTGFGFVKSPEGQYISQGATEHDIRLMCTHAGPDVGVKASGGIATLDQLLRFYDLGARRFGTSGTEGILAEARLRFGER